MRAPEASGAVRERRVDNRFAAYGFPLLAPAAACLVDCAARGAGIETSAHLGVGSLTSISVLSPAGELPLVGRVCWARLVRSRPLGAGDSEPVYRAGLSFLDGQALGAWRGLVSGLLSPAAARELRRPRRRVVKWRPPTERRADAAAAARRRP